MYRAVARGARSEARAGRARVRLSGAALARLVGAATARGRCCQSKACAAAMGRVA
jgi:hypothetical protein